MSAALKLINTEKRAEAEQAERPQFSIQMSRAVVGYGGTIARISATGGDLLGWSVAEVYGDFAGGIGVRFQGGASDAAQAAAELAQLEQLMTDVFGDRKVQYEGMSEPGTLREFCLRHVESKDSARQARLERKERGRWKTTDGIPEFVIVIDWHRWHKQHLAACVEVFPNDEWLSSKPFHLSKYIISWNPTVHKNRKAKAVRFDAPSAGGEFINTDNDYSTRLQKAAREALAAAWKANGLVFIQKRGTRGAVAPKRTKLRDWVAAH